MAKYWTFLFFAGLLEVAWAISLKFASGFTQLVPSVLTAVFMAGSVGLLGLAVDKLPIGTAYAVWTGIGTIGSAVLGIYCFGESASVFRLACVAIIAGAIVALRFAN